MKTNSIKTTQIFTREELKNIRGGDYGYGCTDECTTSADCKLASLPDCSSYYDQTCGMTLKFCVKNP